MMRECPFRSRHPTTPIRLMTSGTGVLTPSPNVTAIAAVSNTSLLSLLRSKASGCTDR
jgi:hypothetical protein